MCITIKIAGKHELASITAALVRLEEKVDMTRAQVEALKAADQAVRDAVLAMKQRVDDAIAALQQPDADVDAVTTDLQGLSSDLGQFHAGTPSP